MTGDRIAVSFGEIQEASSTISSQAREIDQVLDDIRSEVTKTLGDWEGDGSEAYKEAQGRWDTAAADLNAVLAAIGTAVGQAGEAYQNAERSNTTRW